MSVNYQTFYCELHGVGQGIDKKATELEQKRFERFVAEHIECAADVAASERVRRVRMTK